MVSQHSINPTEEGMLSEGKSDPTLLGREEEENRALIIVTRFGYGLLVPAILIFESVVTILINGSSPELKKRCSRIFVNNLAISGAFIGVVSFVMTFFVIGSFRDIAVSCNLEILPFYWTLTYLHMVSVTSLLCLSFDRYLAICWPLRYHEFLTTARCRNMVVACWVLSLACLLVPTLSRYISLVAFQNKSDSLRQVSNSPSFSSSDASRIMKSSAATDCQTRGNRTSREMELWLTCRRAFTVSFGVSYFFSLFLILCMYALVMREFCLLNRRVHATTTSMEKEDQRARIKSTRDLILVATLYLTLSLPHMGGSVQSMSLGWEEASLTGGNDVDWEGHGTKFENTSADQEMRFPSRSGSDENWIETWQDDKETVLLEPGETASFSFTFGNQPTTKYVEYRISSPRALSASHSSLVFTCEMKPLQNSSDCRGGKVKIGYRQKTLR